MTLPTTYKIPTIAELHKDNIEEAFKNEELKVLLNHPPKPEWIKEHPFVKGYKYLPIDKVEFLLEKIFKQYRIEEKVTKMLLNAVFCSVRVHYLNPATQTWEFHDGVGACEIQTKKETGYLKMDMSNISSGALTMAVPIAKTMAIKDACDHFGNIFGRNLNRKDTLPYSNDLQEMAKVKAETSTNEFVKNLGI